MELPDADRPAPSPPLPVSSHTQLAKSINLSLAECRRQRKSLVLLVFTIDRIGQIAENGGIGAATTPQLDDVVMDHLAQRLRAGVRIPDQVVRLVGQRLGVVLSAVGRREGGIVMARLQQALDGPCRCETWLLAAESRVGLALYPQDGVTAAELMRAAGLPIDAVAPALPLA